MKDVIEEALFARRRHLFTELELVFFDTTSLYFEAEGGQTLSQYGYSKDHRPDCKQMIVGVVLVEIDEAKIRREERYDGTWVIQTDRTDLSVEDVVLKYKELWMVEDMHRTGKSVLGTRPIYDKRDETIRGHVFCSFLALLLRTELLRRIEDRGERVEWARLISDLEALRLTEVVHHDQHFLLRMDVRGDGVTAFQGRSRTRPIACWSVWRFEKMKHIPIMRMSSDGLRRARRADEPPRAPLAAS